MTGAKKRTDEEQQDKAKKMAATAVARPKAAPGKKRVLVEFSVPLLKRAEEAASLLSTDRSKFIRNAVEQSLALIERQKFEMELAQSYAANASFNLELSAEFAHIDGEHFE
jgi:hypothetical protein